MILRFKLYSIAGATALFSTPGDAFSVPPTITSRAASSSTARHSTRLNPDWDNDDFLSSLGGGQEQLGQANEKYYAQAEKRAEMDAWRAKQMMQQQPQQQQQQMQPPVNPQQQMQPPQQMQQPPPAQQQQFFDANGNPVNMPMVYDANGNLVPFNPATQQQPPPPAQPQMPPPVAPGPDPIIAAMEPPLPQKTKGTDTPRPVGYNPDAYTMSNTADVYFAQLKQDSKVRKIARMSGDVERANQVFSDESVKQIGQSWVVNPYTKEKNLAEARSEIEGTVRMQVSGGDDEGSKLSSGVSYREKLEQMKRSKGGQASPSAVVAPPKVEQQMVNGGHFRMEPPQQNMVGTSVPLKVGQPMQSSPLASTPAAAAVAPSGSADDEDVRGKIRTAQGLLLKHRGGPGFGAGRLKGAEAQKLEDTLEDVSSILRSEVGMERTASPTHTIPSSPAVPTPAQAATMVSMTPAQTMPDPLAGSVACVEATLKMYKDSSPADREAMMVPLREALMAAAAASNKYIAETELSNHRAAMNDGPTGAVMEAAAASVGSTAPVTQEPMMGFPSTYAVTKPDDEISAQPIAQSSPAATAVMDKAENEKKLQDVYNALSNARGAGGKLGLRNNISGDEASELVEQLVTMRSVLLDELNSGS